MKPLGVVLSVLFVIISLFLSLPSHTQAQGIAVTDPQTIINAGTATPLGVIKRLGNFDVNNKGNIVFRALVENQGQEEEGIFLLKDGLIQKVFEKGDSLPGGRSINLFDCALAINDNNDIVLEVYDQNLVPSIFLYRSGELTEVVSMGQTTPISGTYSSNFACVSMGLSTGRLEPRVGLNNLGQVVFGSAVNAGTYKGAFFLWSDGTTVPIVGLAQGKPNGDVFRTLANPQLTDNGKVYFQNFGSSIFSESEVFEWENGSFRRLLKNGDTIFGNKSVGVICDYYVNRSSSEGLLVNLSYLDNSQHKIGIVKREGDFWEKVINGEDTLPDGEPFDGNRGSEDCFRSPKINSQGHIIFQGRSFAGGPGRKVYAKVEEETILLDPLGFATNLFITNTSKIFYQVGNNEIRSSQLTVPLDELPKEKRALIYVQGITSFSSCEDGEGFLNRAPSWLNDYLKSQTWIKAKVEITDTAYFSYRSLSSSDRYCDGGDGSNGSPPQYTAVETCDQGIDEAYYDQLKTLVQDVTDRNPGQKVTIIAHSQGGLIASYLVGKLREEDPGFLKDRIASVVTFDSFPEGLPTVVIEPLQLFYAEICRSLNPPNINDWYAGGSIAKTAKTAAQPFIHENGTKQVKFYTLDAGDDFVINQLTDIQREIIHDQIPDEDHSALWTNDSNTRSTRWNVSKKQFVGCAVILVTSCGLQSLKDPLLPGQTTTSTFAILSGSPKAIITASWLGSTVKVTPVKPDGTRVDQDNLPQGATFVKGENFATFEFENPEPGNWILELFGEDLPPEGEPVTLLLDIVPPSDTTPPSSQVTSKLLLNLGKIPYDLTFSANDTSGVNKASASGVAYTELWFRRAQVLEQTKLEKLLPEKIKNNLIAINGKWGTWSKYEDDGVNEFQLSPISFTPPVTGLYEFYTRAVDNAGNYEDAPTKADVRYFCINVKGKGLCLKIP